MFFRKLGSTGINVGGTWIETRWYRKFSEVLTRHKDRESKHQRQISVVPGSISVILRNPGGTEKSRWYKTDSRGESRWHREIPVVLKNPWGAENSRWLKNQIPEVNLGGTGINLGGTEIPKTVDFCSKKRFQILIYSSEINEILHNGRQGSYEATPMGIISKSHLF